MLGLAARHAPASVAGSFTETETVRALRAMAAFRDLPPRVLSGLAPKVALRRVDRGETLFERGEPADTLFLVSSGRFFVFVDSSSEPVAEIAAGEPVGELAFLTGQPRTASVVAARDSQVLEVSRSAYDHLMLVVPRVQQLLLTRLAERMWRMAPAAPPLLRSPARTVGLVGIGGSPIPETLVRRLREALEVFGRTELLRPGDLSGDPESIDATFRRLEQESRFVICPVGDDATEADVCALHHCDSVILVGRLADGPREGGTQRPLEREALRLFRERSRSLVLWRDRAVEPIAGSAAWLAHRNIALHHHVALDQPGDIARLARFIAGRALGAVFGGGGALGCGHIGLARAFRDAGVAFDFFGGTSAGAAMALALAAGRSPEEVMDRTEEMFVRKRALRRYTLPVFSLLDHTVFDCELQRNYAGLDLADLPVNGYAVSTNLTRNAMQVHRTGPVWQAVRSSGAIPGALPPFVDSEGDVLVDGALVDNLPVATMRDLKLGPNVLAGFFEDQSRRYRADYACVPGRFRLVADLLLRRRTRFPGILTVIERSMLVSSRRTLQDAKVGGDLLVRLPSPPGVRVMDWQKGRGLEKAAYDYVSQLIAQAGGARALLESSANLACAAR